MMEFKENNITQIPGLEFVINWMVNP